jgi:hypothetical protein
MSFLKASDSFLKDDNYSFIFLSGYYIFGYCALESLYNLHLNPLSDVEYADVFFHSEGCMLTLLIASYRTVDFFPFVFLFI